MRQVIVLVSLLFAASIPALGQVGYGMGAPTVSIGINFPVYPQFQQVPSYPVYYAPQVDSNYFFYDGMYWVFVNDNWYASSWYNGPWALVSPMVVPVYILRVPVRYYREPPVYFRGYRQDGPPPWANHWGNDWQRQRAGWDHWNRNSVPPPAPLPVYQQQYSGRRYPSLEQQRTISSQNYHYQPHDPVVREHFEQAQGPMPPASDQRAQKPHEAPQPESQRPPQPGELQREPDHQLSRTAPPHQPPHELDNPAPPPEPQRHEPYQSPPPVSQTPRTEPPYHAPPHQTQSQIPGEDHGPPGDNAPKAPKPQDARDERHDAAPDKENQRDER